MSDPETTSHFAPEIEQAAVSILWHEPNRVTGFLRELDPALHLVQPHLRRIVEAVNLAWAELNVADWATVIQVVRELGAYDDCGGLEGLNSVYSIAEYRCDKQKTDVIFTHYVDMLKSYAAARIDRIPIPQTPFTGTRATLSLNKVRRSAFDPDFIGRLRIAGVFYQAKIWKATNGEFLNLDLRKE